MRGEFDQLHASSGFTALLPRVDRLFVLFNAGQLVADARWQTSVVNSVGDVSLDADGSEDFNPARRLLRSTNDAAPELAPFGDVREVSAQHELSVQSAGDHLRSEMSLADLQLSERKMEMQKPWASPNCLKDEGIEKWLATPITPIAEFAKSGHRHCMEGASQLKLTEILPSKDDVTWQKDLASLPQCCSAASLDSKTVPAETNAAPCLLNGRIPTYGDRVRSIEATLRATKDILNSLGPHEEIWKQWAIDSGTLIGSIRCGNILPWDVDGDIVVASSLMSALNKNMGVFHNRFLLTRKKSGSIMDNGIPFVVVDLQTGFYIDIFRLDNVGNQPDRYKHSFVKRQDPHAATVTNWLGSADFNNSGNSQGRDIAGMTCMIGDDEYPCPGNLQAVLETLYGKRWCLPDATGASDVNCMLSDYLRPGSGSNSDKSEGTSTDD